VNLAEIEETMAALALVRPLFHSEADFQHAVRLAAAQRSRRRADPLGDSSATGGAS